MRTYDATIGVLVNSPKPGLSHTPGVSRQGILNDALFTYVMRFIRDTP